MASKTIEIERSWFKKNSLGESYFEYLLYDLGVKDEKERQDTDCIEIEYWDYTLIQ